MPLRNVLKCISLYWFYPQAAFKALKRTLQLIAPLHDIVAYLVSFAKLGNCAACFEFPLSPNPLRGDWGGTEGIGEWLKVIQITFNIHWKFYEALNTRKDRTTIYSHKWQQSEGQRKSPNCLIDCLHTAQLSAWFRIHRLYHKVHQVRSWEAWVLLCLCHLVTESWVLYSLGLCLSIYKMEW